MIIMTVPTIENVSVQISEASWQYAVQVPPRFVDEIKTHKNRLMHFLHIEIEAYQSWGNREI
jgi:hypothetical protein